MRIILTGLVLALVVALASPFAVAQATGGIKGKVLDEKGQPAAAAKIEVQHTGTGKKFETVTNEQGDYAFAGLPVGAYKLSLFIGGQMRFQAQLDVTAAADANGTIDLAAAAREAAMTPEERKKAEDERKRLEAEYAKRKNINARLAEAKKLQDAGDLDGALAIYQETVTTDPTKDVLWANLADALATKATKAADRTAKTELALKAVEAYQKAIALKPNHAGYHNNLGLALVLAGKTDEAVPQYEQAAQLDPQNAAQYYYNLGAVLTNRGKVDDANAAFDRAIAADPKKAEAYYWKGVNLLGKASVDPKTNQMVAPPEAADMFNKYLELQPEGPFAATAKDMLASIGAEVTTGYKRGKKK